MSGRASSCRAAESPNRFERGKRSHKASRVPPQTGGGGSLVSRAPGGPCLSSKSSRSSRTKTSLPSSCGKSRGGGPEGNNVLRLGNEGRRHRAWPLYGAVSHLRVGQGLNRIRRFLRGFVLDDPAALQRVRGVDFRRQPRVVPGPNSAEKQNSRSCTPSSARRFPSGRQRISLRTVVVFEGTHTGGCEDSFWIAIELRTVHGQCLVTANNA